MTNQTPALLVQRAQWTQAAVMFYFSRPPPPTAIIPDARSLGTFEIKMATINGKTRYISTTGDREEPNFSRYPPNGEPARRLGLNTLTYTPCIPQNKGE